MTRALAALLVVSLTACTSSVPAGSDGAIGDGGVPPGDADLQDGALPADGALPPLDGAMPLPMMCGNGALDPGERCDPAIATGAAGACPTSCEPEACSTATIVGDGCDVRCETAPESACLDDDGCCPSACDAITDTDCFESVTAFGTIYLGAYIHPTTTVSTASASFTGRTSVSSSCTITTDGDCTLYECPTTGVAPTISYLSAGRVTIAGGRSGAIVMDPNPDRTYPPARFMESSPEWSAGTAITVSGSGATVPAFTLSSRFPGALTPTSPTPTMTATGLRITATRSAGLRFTWTGERTGDAVAGMSQVVGTTSRSVSCRFPASAGSGTMPAALLQRLSATDADGAPATYVSMNHGGKTERVLAGDTLVTLWMSGSTGMSAIVDLR